VKKFRKNAGNGQKTRCPEDGQAVEDFLQNPEKRKAKDN
jgi:hypothetical protein